MLLTLLGAAVLLTLAFSQGALQHWLSPQAIIDLLRQSGAAVGILPAMAVFAVASVLAVPLSVMTPLFIMAFGPVNGLACAMCGGLLGSAVSYGIGKALGHQAICQLAPDSFMAVSRRLEQRGILAALLLRLIPVAPFAVINMVAGASPIRLRDFLIGSTLGMIPAMAFITLFVDRLMAALVM